ncbi:hypothetical protein QJS66_02940 [Kocuria rhizophila]|nr:hypothetical protein QJS66_02940 [Kocuria rhizophila]
MAPCGDREAVGHDLESARELDAIVERVFHADSVFRIDHYLGKETVQNILALRLRQPDVRAAVGRRPWTTCRSPWPRRSRMGSVRGTTTAWGRPGT